MESGRNQRKVLAGSPRREGHGTEAEVVQGVVSSPLDAPGRGEAGLSGARVLLAAPLLRVVGPHGRRRVVVGQFRVGTGRDTAARVTLAVQAVWSETGGWHQEPVVPGEADEALVASLAEPAHAVVGDERSTAVTMAKAFAESSRNEVLRLRELRYELEQSMADHLAGRAGGPLRPLLAAAVELSTAVGRARDQAVEAARSGLWVWLWDREAYRRVREPEAKAGGEPGWTPRLRAGIRHCEAMDRELAEEVERLHSLLGSMSTFAVAQGTEAQERFTLAVGAGAAVIGLPALVLSLYGANAYLPMDSFDRAWRLLLPVGTTALAAVTAVVAWMPGASRPRHYLVAAGTVAALLSVLLLAGVLVPS
ncbi:MULTISPECIES: hypothetical protein [Nocardiopsis]|uniref:Magnesium transporter n=1 Tax=Nocardiopsis sinuspersici TaxID=501010 RepID=A0A1V3C3C5_9ACTN|nr:MULTISPECIES: hypothetical protein [Nocardiopsis]OOC54870.1 hypothetical protein NOSIN_14560 [Nocardiopsis sinuspersici]